MFLKIKNDADIVGAINILRKYQVERITMKNLPADSGEVKPVEYGIAHTMKQESAGNREGLPLPG